MEDDTVPSLDTTPGTRSPAGAASAEGPACCTIPSTWWLLGLATGGLIVSSLCSELERDVQPETGVLSCLGRPLRSRTRGLLSGPDRRLVSVMISRLERRVGLDAGGCDARAETGSGMEDGPSRPPDIMCVGT